MASERTLSVATATDAYLISPSRAAAIGAAGSICAAACAGAAMMTASASSTSDPVCTANRVPGRRIASTGVPSRKIHPSSRSVSAWTSRPIPTSKLPKIGAGAPAAGTGCIRRRPRMRELLRSSAWPKMGAEVAASNRSMSPALMLPSSGPTTCDAAAAPSRTRTMSPTLGGPGRTRTLPLAPLLGVSIPSGCPRRAASQRGRTYTAASAERCRSIASRCNRRAVNLRGRT